MKITVNPEILAVKDKLLKHTAYDVRAYVGEVGSFFSSDAVLTPASIEIIGVIMGSIVFKCDDGSTAGLNIGDSVVVGYDNGPTSKVLAEHFSKGLMSQGVNVYNIGVASSGQVYRNQTQLKAQGHVQITRSHVEVTTNGAKFGIGSQGIHTYLLKQMNDEMSKKIIGRDAPEGKMIDKSIEGFELYHNKMVERYGKYFKEHPRKLAVNLFGGTGLKYKELYEEIFGKSNVIILGDNIDVNGGKILADPTRTEMLEKVPGLKEALAQGLRVHSFDLDADRGSITEGADALETGASGHYLGDDISYILAEYRLSFSVPKMFIALSGEKIPAENLDRIHKIASTVLVDPRYTGSVNTFVKSLGGETEYHSKGHSLWKETMTANMKKLVSLAGCGNTEEFLNLCGHYVDLQMEASLHFFATDPEDGTPKDDAVENVFIFEQILDKLNIKKLKDFFSKIPRRFTTKEIRTTSISNEIKEKVTYKVIDVLKKEFSESRFLKVEFDGQLRVEWSTGFIMYGMSNTSPKLTMMAEGVTQEERNNALAYIIALNNSIKAEYGDTYPMDLNENFFFMDDKSYNMPEPDKIGMSDPRVAEFKKYLQIG